MAFIFWAGTAVGSADAIQERALVFEHRDSREQLGAPRSCGVWFEVMIPYYCVHYTIVCNIHMSIYTYTCMCVYIIYIYTFCRIYPSGVHDLSCT